MDRLKRLFLKTINVEKCCRIIEERMIDKLRRELHRAIQEFGIAHIKTLKISEKLDIEIVKEQKRRFEQ